MTAEIMQSRRTPFLSPRYLNGSVLANVLRAVGALALASGAFAIGYLLNFPGEMRTLLDATFFSTLMLHVALNWSAAAAFSYLLFLFAGSSTQNDLLCKIIGIILNPKTRRRASQSFKVKRDLFLNLVLVHSVRKSESMYWRIALLLRIPFAVFIFSVIYFGLGGALLLTLASAVLLTIIFPAQLISLFKSKLDKEPILTSIAADTMKPHPVAALLAFGVTVSLLAGYSHAKSLNHNPMLCIVTEEAITRQRLFGTTSAGMILMGTDRPSDYNFIPFERVRSLAYPPCSNNK